MVTGAREIRDQRSLTCFLSEVIRPKLLTASSMSEAVSWAANSNVAAQRSQGRLTCQVRADAMLSATYSGDAYSVNPNAGQSGKPFLVADFLWTRDRTKSPVDMQMLKYILCGRQSERDGPTVL